jgi:hypothetical protein
MRGVMLCGVGVGDAGDTAYVASPLAITNESLGFDHDLLDLGFV